MHQTFGKERRLEGQDRRPTYYARREMPVNFRLKRADFVDTQGRYYQISVERDGGAERIVRGQNGSIKLFYKEPKTATASLMSSTPQSKIELYPMRDWSVKDKGPQPPYTCAVEYLAYRAPRSKSGTVHVSGLSNDVCLASILARSGGEGSAAKKKK